jgi:hypothetical protein
MPRRIAMSDLVERCKLRADKMNDDHILTPEWQSHISEIFGDLYSVVAGTGLRYFETTATLTTTGVAYVSEPSDHLATVRLDYIDSAGRRYPLDELMPQEQPEWGNASSATRAFAYALVDDRVYFYPTPAANQTYQIVYIPQPPSLVDYADADTVDVVTPDGEAFLIYGAAALALSKAKQDTSRCDAKQAEARDRLLEWATMRAFGGPRRRAAINEFDGGGYGYEEGDYRR